jgi:hypothetical protein
LTPFTKTVKLTILVPVIVTTGLLSVVPCTAYNVSPGFTGKEPVDSLNGIFPESSVNVDIVPPEEELVNVAFQFGVAVGVGVGVDV